MTRILVLLAFALLLTAAPALAQTTPPACAPGDFATAVASVQASLTAIAAPSSEDLPAAIAALHALHADLVALEAQCAGLSWQGDGSDALGPVTLPAGTYIAAYRAETAQALGVLVFEFENLSADELTAPILVSFRGDAPADDRRVVHLEGGSYLIAVDTNQTRWSLTLTTP